MDRTTKALLALIAVALWGLLLKPLIALPAAQAAPTTAISGLPATDYDQSYHRLLVTQGGHVYLVETSPKLRVMGSVTLK